MEGEKRQEKVFSGSMCILDEEGRKAGRGWEGAGVEKRIVAFGDPHRSGKLNVGLLECTGMFTTVKDN